jgi:RNA polymerase sigma factor (sigma-70 family)
MTRTPISATATFEAARRRLLSIAYRMLGSVAEAEDVVQETWLRWHEAQDFQLKTPLKTPVAWLTTVATRLAIDRLRHLQHERATTTVPWLPEPWMDEHAPSAEDAVSMLSDLSYGVLLMLERLNPDERAALLLHEVFDCQYEEIARTLDKTPVHCRQLVRRAKERVQSDRVRRIADEHVCRETAQEFVAAICRQDKQAMLLLLAPDAVVTGNGSIGTQAASSFVSGLMSANMSGMQIECACINGGWGATLFQHGKIALALSFEMDGPAIRTVYAIAGSGRQGQGCPPAVLQLLQEAITA